MNCELCQNWMQQRLDGEEIVETPELVGHLTTCPACAALHATSRKLSAGLRLLAPPCPPFGMTERLVAGILADQRAQRQRGRVRVAVYALAASLLFSVAGFGMYASGWRPFAANQSQPPIVQIEPPAPETPKVIVKVEPPPETPKRDATPSMRESVTDASNALASLTTRTADETVGQTRLLVPMVTGPSLDGLDQAPALEPTKSYLEAGQGVSVALDPVTNSAHRAINLFRRDLPQMNKISAPKSEIRN